jgi:hypothetical protein
MNAIKLDPRKLLGFKIIADSESTVRLTSPKIGDKGAPVIAQAIGTGPLTAKIGTKSD